VDAESLLVDLDPDQRRAVTTESRLVAVIAGAGSGKTRVLTRRVAHRVATGSADARHTLALTFTREAAGELRRRLSGLGITERVEAGTFHSIALGLLRRRWADTGRRAPTVVDDRSRIVGEMLAARSGRPGPELADLVTELDWASARGLDPDGYARAARSGARRSRVADRIPELLDAYQREKRRRGIVDLDDLLRISVEELGRDANFAEATRWRFRHLLVDEAQDLNPLQQALVDTLRVGSDDLFVVGDPAQSVYGFTGSDPGLLVDVEDRFPGIEVIRLPVNHRCTPQVVAAGVAVLTHAGMAADLRSGREDGPAVTITGHPDERAEADAVATAVARLDPGGTRPGRAAVLARTHAQCRLVEDALRTAGVTVRARGLDADPVTRRALDSARRRQSSAALRDWAHAVLEESADDLERDPAESSGDITPAMVAAAALDHLRQQPDGDGATFASWLVTEDPFGRRDRDGVEVLTFHAAKGREWHRVWLVGVETGSVPHRSATTRDAVAEEARLLYVAVTRASDACAISHAERRGGYRREPSPFLADVDTTPRVAVGPPPEVVAVIAARRHRPDRERRVALERWRADLARATGAVPESICSDRILSRLVDRPPTTVEDLDRLTRWGPLTSARLLPGLLAALDG
jgi:DNA helicase-2/ATP-dependent DNA helicase PcrA